MASRDKSGKTRPANFAQLAKELGWTTEQLRLSQDLPEKTDQQLGTRVIRLPTAILEDPFKGKPSANADDEYKQLETRFYNKLSRIQPVGNKSRTPTSGTTTNHVKVKVAGGRQSEIKLHVEKGHVDATINTGASGSTENSESSDASKSTTGKN